MEGIKVATGDVIVILDAHCEAVPDWLRPLLQRIKEKADAVVLPDIVNIGTSDFQIQNTHDSEEVAALLQLFSI